MAYGKCSINTSYPHNIKLGKTQITDLFTHTCMLLTWPSLGIESLSLSVCLHLVPVFLLLSPDCKGLGLPLSCSILSLWSLSHHLYGPPLLILSHSSSDFSDLCCLRGQLHIAFWTSFCQASEYVLNCLLCAEPHAGGFCESTEDGRTQTLLS